MEIKKKIFVAGPPGNYHSWMNTDITHDIKKAAFVLFTGGTDINPNLYGCKPHPSTQLPDNKRDAEEKEIFTIAHGLGIPQVGICRGAQFLCAMAGGILVQHQRHPAIHSMKTYDGLSLKVTSDHHQRAYPWVLPANDWKLIGWTENLSPFDEGESSEDNMKDEKEVEIAYYPKFRALGIQSHPEWQWPSKEEADWHTIRYLRILLQKLLANQIV